MTREETIYVWALVEAVLKEKREWAEMLFGTRGIPIFESAEKKLGEEVKRLAR